jgi:hypothetical protein
VGAQLFDVLVGGCICEVSGHEATVRLRRPLHIGNPPRMTP